MQLNQMHADDPCFSAILHLYSKGCSQGTNTINYPSHHQITRPTNHNTVYNPGKHLAAQSPGPFHDICKGFVHRPVQKTGVHDQAMGVASYEKKQSWLKTSINVAKVKNLCVYFDLNCPQKQQRRAKVPVTQIAKVPPVSMRHK